jgi:hypothetical protein
MIFGLLQTSSCLISEQREGKKEYISCFVSSAQKIKILEWSHPFPISKHVNHGEQ